MPTPDEYITELGEPDDNNGAAVAYSPIGNRPTATVYVGRYWYRFDDVAELRAYRDALSRVISQMEADVDDG